MSCACNLVMIVCPPRLAVDHEATELLRTLTLMDALLCEFWACRWRQIRHPLGGTLSDLSSLHLLIMSNDDVSDQLGFIAATWSCAGRCIMWRHCRTACSSNSQRPCPKCPKCLGIWHTCLDQTWGGSWGVPDCSLEIYSSKRIQTNPWAIVVPDGQRRLHSIKTEGISIVCIQIYPWCIHIHMYTGVQRHTYRRQNSWCTFDGEVLHEFNPSRKEHHVPWSMSAPMTCLAECVSLHQSHHRCSSASGGCSLYRGGLWAKPSGSNMPGAWQSQTHWQKAVCIFN